MGGGRLNFREALLIGLAMSFPIIAFMVVEYHPEPMLKRNEKVTVAERRCGTRPFSSFIMYERGFIRRGMYDFYSGSHKITEDEIIEFAKRSDDYSSSDGNITEISSGYFGDISKIYCMDLAMRRLGYDRRDPMIGQRPNKFSWMALDKVD